MMTLQTMVGVGLGNFPLENCPIFSKSQNVIYDHIGTNESICKAKNLLFSVCCEHWLVMG